MMDARFEIDVLFAVNEVILKCEIPSEEEIESVVENVMSAFGNVTQSFGCIDAGYLLQQTEEE